MRPDEPYHYPGLIDRYRQHLPLQASTPAISLGEGNTTLLQLRNIPRQLGLDFDVYVKLEGQNPTGSFKDRGMTVAVTHALEQGAQRIVCASTGNTSASAAAYAARAGITALVLIPQGKIALGKLAQAMMHGAVVLQINGNFDDGMQLVKQVAADSDIALVNSVNPYRIQGQKTVAFEVLEQLGRAPDYHCLPVGNAGNISAHWIGYWEACGDRSLPTQACGFCNGECRYAAHPTGAGAAPKLLGYQAAGAAPLIAGSPVEQPETIATAIRIGNPQSADFARAAVAESGGWLAACTDEELLTAQQLLADHEGVFCEPASAISLAGLIKDASQGRIKPGSSVVCTLTGHGLKDPDTAIARAGDAVLSIGATLAEVRAVLQDC